MGNKKNRDKNRSKVVFSGVKYQIPSRGDIGGSEPEDIYVFSEELKQLYKQYLELEELFDLDYFTFDPKEQEGLLSYRTMNELSKQVNNE